MTPRSAEERREVCRGCGYETDPDMCWCGSYIEEHGMYDGHQPVPMGCVCPYRVLRAEIEEAR